MGLTARLRLALSHGSDLFNRRIVCYMSFMAAHAQTQVVPANFPELRRLTWNRVPERAIDMADAFQLYERNWRHVDKDHLTPPERQLIDRLGDLFGQGFRLV